MYYFAYGSNMSLLRLRARVPSAKRVGLYQLNDHQLRFDKASEDGSGKGNIVQAHQDRVFGAVFIIDGKEKAALDAVEGLGLGYEIKTVSVQNSHGNSIEAFTYYATDINAELKPYCWYLNHVIIGAKETNVPLDYLQRIQTINCIKDANAARSMQEYDIYRNSK